MTTKGLILLVTALLVSGCAVYTPVSYPDDGGTDGGGKVIIIDNGPVIDAYVSIPRDVAELISGEVYGYSLPPVSRYGSEIYPYNGIRDWENMPSYICTDFNGDYRDDYAYMFTKINWQGSDWYLTTKMLIVTSNTYGGYKLSLNLDLGTVTGSMGTPVEEFWGIGLMKAGTHTITTYYNHSATEESVDLDNDGIYLTSIDPEERSLFYVLGSSTYEMSWDMGALAKRKPAQNDSRADRLINLADVKARITATK